MTMCNRCCHPFPVSLLEMRMLDQMIKDHGAMAFLDAALAATADVYLRNVPIQQMSDKDVAEQTDLSAFLQIQKLFEEHLAPPKCVDDDGDEDGDT